MDIQAEKERVRNLLPTTLPDTCYDVMIGRGFLGKNKLIYNAEWVLNGEKHERKVKLKCTACGKQGYAEHKAVQYSCWRGGYDSECGFVHPDTREVMRGYTETLCPYCGAAVQTRNRSTISEFCWIDDVSVMTVHKIEGYLALIKWELEKQCDRDGDVYYTQRGEEAAVLIGKRFVRYAKGTYTCYSTYKPSQRWEERKRFDDMFNAVDPAKVLQFEVADVTESSAAKSALEVYLQDGDDECFPVRYLKLWQKYPNVENLIRTGATPLVSSYIKAAMAQIQRGRFAFYYEMFCNMDLKKAKPHEMLGVQKEEYAKVRGMRRYIFLLYKIMRERGVQEIDEMLEIDQKGKFGDAVNFFVEHQELPIVHTMRYLQKQKECCKDKTLIKYSYLEDYWHLVESVQGRVDEELRFPKNLETEHDRFVLRLKEKENAAMSQAIAERVSALERWAFTDEELGLLIRPAASHAEFITEGKVLCHCVAMYAKSHMEGKTTIFFIRKTDEPDMPFYTLEYKNGRVQQNRGKKKLCADSRSGGV